MLKSFEKHTDKPLVCGVAAHGGGGEAVVVHRCGLNESAGEEYLPSIFLTGPENNRIRVSTARRGRIIFVRKSHNAACAQYIRE